MKSNNQWFLYVFLALATVAALSGSAIAAVDRQLPEPGSMDLRIPSPVFNTGSAEGAVMPGKPGSAEVKPEKTFAADPFSLLFVGATIIALAYLGRRIFQK